MHLTARGWIAAARLRRRAARERGTQEYEWEARKELIRRFAPERSFADIGCMWEAHGEVAFRAEEAGATAVTAFDAMEPTERYREREKGSSVRFVRGDLHDPAAGEAIGVHDVVWCTGLLYHTPHPILMLERLAAITRETLILGTHSIPEVPGIEGGCVLYPALGDGARAAHAQAWPPTAVGVAAPWDHRPEMSYANYWWGISPSALRGMLDVSGFEVEELIRRTPFNTDVIARRRRAAP
jgi:hypothetical protein